MYEATGVIGANPETRGRRTYRLVPEGPHRTRFTMREEYSGPLAPLITKSIPDLQPSFNTFAECLRKQAETRHEGG